MKKIIKNQLKRINKIIKALQRLEDTEQSPEQAKVTRENLDHYYTQNHLLLFLLSQNKTNTINPHKAPHKNNADLLRSLVLFLNARNEHLNDNKTIKQLLKEYEDYKISLR